MPCFSRTFVLLQQPQVEKVYEVDRFVYHTYVVVVAVLASLQMVMKIDNNFEDHMKRQSYKVCIVF